MLIFGRNPILETLRHSPEQILSIKFSETVDKEKISGIIDLARKKSIPIEELRKYEFDRIFDPRNKSEGISQGVIAEIKDFTYTEFDELMSELNSKNKALTLILDEIQDPHNLGAIIRTASAANVDGIILTEKNSAKVNFTVYKTSSGTINFVKIVLTKNIYKRIETLKENGFNIIGTSLKGSKGLYDVKFNDKTAIILGNEEEGVRKMLQRLCDETVKIPIYGKAESLNVSVSAGVILYEVRRQKSKS